MTNVSCFFSELLGNYYLSPLVSRMKLSCEYAGTAVLLIAVLATIDRGNLSPPHGLFPVVLFVLILGIGASLGMETGMYSNPQL